MLYSVLCHDQRHHSSGAQKSQPQYSKHRSSCPIRRFLPYHRCSFHILCRSGANPDRSHCQHSRQNHRHHPYPHFPRPFHRHNDLEHHYSPACVSNVPKDNPLRQKRNGHDSTVFSVSANHTAADLSSGISSRLRVKIIRTAVDYYRPADHIVHRKPAGNKG